MSSRRLRRPRRVPQRSGRTAGQRGSAPGRSWLGGSRSGGLSRECSVPGAASARVPCPWRRTRLRYDRLSRWSYRPKGRPEPHRPVLGLGARVWMRWPCVRGRGAPPCFGVRLSYDMTGCYVYSQPSAGQRRGGPERSSARCCREAGLRLGSGTHPIWCELCKGTADGCRS